MAKYKALVNIQYSTWGFAKPGEEFEVSGEVDSNIAELLTVYEEQAAAAADAADEEPKPKRRRKAEVEVEE